MKSNLEIGGNSGITYPWDRQLMVLIILKSDFQELKGLYIYEPSVCRKALRAGFGPMNYAYYKVSN